MTSRIAEHLSVPLFRSGYALAANTIATAALGAVYWIVAARLFPADQVGVAAALIAAMTLLANVAGLNLNNALNRFLPSAGAGSTDLMRTAYLVAVPLTGLVAVVFVAGIDIWTPGLDVVRSSSWAATWFVVATMLWAIFVLQDAGLAGLRRATWILAENVIYGGLKILLLVVFAAGATALGIFASWTVPLIALIVPVNVLLFRVAIPAHRAANDGTRSGWEPRAVARYAAVDYGATLIWRATTSVLPIVVLEIAGAEANAYFYLAWTIAYTLYLVSRSTGIALITEGALEPERLMVFGRRVLAQTTALVAPAAVVIAAAAPLLLGIFGTAYAEEGTALLRLLVLSAIPNIVVNLYVSIARVQQTMRSIVLLYAALAVCVIGATIVLLPRVGLAGVGWAWLATQTVFATWLMATRLRSLWLPAVAAVPGATRVASLVGPGRRIERQSALASGRLGAVAEALDQRLGDPSGAPWHVHSLLPTELDLAVASLGKSGGPPSMVVKLAATDGASVGVRTEANALRDLYVRDDLAGWLRCVPEVMLTGDVDGYAYFVERHLPGDDARDLAARPETIHALVRSANEAISHLHSVTSQTIRIGDDAVGRWIDQPLEDLNDLLRSGDRKLRRRSSDRLRTELTSSLEGRQIDQCWIHGDYWLGNMLAESAAITGIVDWGQTDRQGTPAMDVLHLLLTTRVLTRSQPLGHVVLEAVADPDWEPWELDTVGTFDGRNGSEPSLRSLILVTWLRHVASNVRKSYRYRKSMVWTTENVDNVLSRM